MKTSFKGQTEHLPHITAMIDALFSMMIQYNDDSDVSFDEKFHQLLRRIDAASRDCLSTERRTLMKYCFEKTAPELDTSNIHWRGRHKPLGYAGDFLSINLT